MKKFTLVAIFMALSNAIVADEIDNTIDFKSITPTQTPQSITQDADNLYQGIQPNPPQNATQNSQPIFTQTGYKSTKKGDFDFEFGVGYVMGLFDAEQSLDGVQKTDSSGIGHGADVFFSGSYYAGESWGIMFGLGSELINISWSQALTQLSCMSNTKCDEDTNASELMINAYLNFGGFKDLWGRNKSSLRLFGNIGVSFNLLGGLYERNTTCSEGTTIKGYYTTWTTYNCEMSQEYTKPVSIPFTLGLRYMFVENHGLEFVGKYDLIKWEFTTKAPAISSFDTTISRNLSLGLRYIYKF